MKILYHHRTLGDGAEGIHIREMVAAFRKLGHEVEVISPVGETDGTGNVKSGKLGSLKRSIPRFVFELCEIGYSAYIFFYLILKIAKVRPDFIYDRYITFNFGTVLAAKLLGVPLFLEVNAPLALERSAEPDEQLIFRKTAFAIERWVCSSSKKTIVVSTPLKEYLVSQGVPEEKCVVMPNGVDPEKFYPHEKDRQLLRKIGARDDDIIVGFTGILRSWHGLDMLVDAVASLKAKGKNVFLLIVGDGPVRAELEDQIVMSGLEESFCITGRVGHDEVPSYVNLFDIAVSPKATFYASPMKVIEYMALGKAVIVPNTQNLLDIVDPGVSGVVFDSGKTKNLSEQIEYLYDARTEIVRIGHKAREKSEERLNWQFNACRVCRL